MANELDELLPLPASLVFTERAAALLRAHLLAEGLDDYHIYVCDELDLADIDYYFDGLGESDAQWQPLACGSTGDAEPVALLTYGTRGARRWPAGVLRLRAHDIVLARWFWADAEQDEQVRRVWLCAAASPKSYFALREQILRLRRGRGASVWQVIRGYAGDDGPRTHREMPPDLIIAPPVRERLTRDVIQFFSPEVQRLYRDLSVPYRRGVLLHGPPGNGKTSLIRFVGASVPHVSAMILRPGQRFDNDNLEHAIKRWSRLAPAMLVIEDLDWLLQRLNVSLFLNMLDGIDSEIGATTGGLLLIATTNNPEKLDPAINNRPGRFDVVIEIPSPDRTLRREFLSLALPQTAAATLETIAARTDGLSFAHLQELLRLSGLSAIHAGRSERSEKDLLDATDSIRRAFEDAVRGFPTKPELPFGLLPLRDRR